MSSYTSPRHAVPVLRPAPRRPLWLVPLIIVLAGLVRAAPLSTPAWEEVRAAGSDLAATVPVGPAEAQAVPVPDADLTPVSASPTPTMTASAAGADDALAAAYQAYQKKDLAALSAALLATRDHPLAAYPELWRLLLAARDPASEKADFAPALRRFIAAHEGEYVAERARADGALLAGENDDRALFEELYRHLEWNQDEPDLVCHRARLALATGDKAALATARETLLNGISGESCGRLAEALAQRYPEQTWPLLLMLAQTRQLPRARALLEATTTPLPADRKILRAVLRSPARWYQGVRARLDRQNAGALLLAALALAPNDLKAAERVALAVSPRLSRGRRELLWSRLALSAARDLDPRALELYQRAGARPGSAPDTMEASQVAVWRARAALRTGDWRAVTRAIERLPADARRSPAWRYWRARAEAATGRGEAARRELAELAKGYGFYALLAADHLERPYSRGQTELDPPAAPEALARVAGDPSITRALRFYALDFLPEGHREWNWALRGQTDRQRLEIASYAAAQGLAHRAINSSDRALPFVLDLRYPRPRRSEFEAAAAASGLPAALVFGLARQESRFIEQAQSRAGASGLLQLMPRTARWAAAQLGIERLSDEMISDPGLNLSLGCVYLSRVRDAFAGSLPLSCAAYNAGPSRAVNWRASLSDPVEGAVFAETIPFNETRNYVQQVLANSVYYSFYYGDAPLRLTDLLGTVTPQSPGPLNLP